MMETGVVINVHGEPIHWHEPIGRSMGSLPDSRTLWDVVWRAHCDGWLAGIAHSHPGSGIPGPSQEDLSTFVAIEAALGRPLTWWITSADRMIVINRALMDSASGQRVSYGSARIPVESEPSWVVELRRRSEVNISPYR